MVPALSTGPGSSQIASWQMLLALSPTSVIAHQRTADAGDRIAMLDETGAHDLLAVPGGANYYVKAARAGSCTVLSTKLGLGVACDGAPYEPAPESINDTSAGDPLYAVEAGGSLWIFTQTYASFTIIERSAQGVWTEHEQYESSVSFPTDAFAVGADTVSCFISAGDHAVVAAGAGHTYSSATAKWCKVALSADKQTVHILTDTGFTSRSLTELTGANDATMTLSPLATPITSNPDRLVDIDGAPHAIVRASDFISLIPVAGGAPLQVPAPSGNYLVTFDPATRALHTISERASYTGDGPEYPQVFRYETYCL